MQWLETEPMPEVCRCCKEEDCYNCDIAGERWFLSHEDELRLRRKSIVKAMGQLKQQLEAIDREISTFEAET